MQRVRTFFWNRCENRLRTGWRILLNLVMWALVQLFAGIVFDSPLTMFLIQFFPAIEPIAENLLFYLVNLVLVVGLTWYMATYIDHRPVNSLGLQFDRHWWHDLLFGLLLGALLMSCIFLTEWYLGWVSVTARFYVDLPRVSFAVAIWQPIVLFIVVGINEELLSRGYQLRNLAEGFATPAGNARSAVIWAWLFSSTLFGLLHIFNPNSTWVSTTVLMLAGSCWGLGYILTGRLGLPIGLHIAWNFFQGNVYGFPVSGNILSATSVLRIQQQGPKLWTGGNFGPEAGIVGILALLVGGVLTLYWVRRSYGQIQIVTSLSEYQRA